MIFKVFFLLIPYKYFKNLLTLLHFFFFNEHRTNLLQVTLLSSDLSLQSSSPSHFQDAVMHWPSLHLNCVPVHVALAVDRSII